MPISQCSDLMQSNIIASVWTLVLVITKPIKHYDLFRTSCTWKVLFELLWNATERYMQFDTKGAH